MTAPTKHRVYHNLYKDSVALMAVSSALMDVEGVQAASVVMATESNRENLRNAGLRDDVEACPNDLLVAVRGDEPGCEEALALADQLLSEQPPVPETGEARQQPPSSVQAAVARDPSVNLALVSVPGPYAAAEALKALRLGLNAMMFSDNVPVEQEIEVKRYAAEHDLLVMGPDCGTALVNGIPLGFANVVRRGRIGVVGASGTGIQEITCRIHQRGAGISQALGTGSHDLSTEVGAISTLQALRMLADDTDTDVIVLVSKPPAAEVATAVLNAARNLTTPVVVMFVGADAAELRDDRLIVATRLAEAADLAVSLLHGETRGSAADGLSKERKAELLELSRRALPSQRCLRGIFSGGTFCYEAQLVAQSLGLQAHSNTPVAGNLTLDDIWASQGHTIIDMGDDAFTRGRPHPMIDPSLRDKRLLAEAEDPATAVLLFDVVLGYGATEDPVAGLREVLEDCQSVAAAAGRSLPVVAHVCGTDEDPQDRSAVVAALTDAGVLMADSNAEAAYLAAFLVPQVAAVSAGQTGVR